jgi:hypothetical protein
VGRKTARLGFSYLAVYSVLFILLSLEPNEMIKKRTRPQTCVRDPSADPSDSAPTQLEENPAQDDENGAVPYVCVPPSA